MIKLISLNPRWIDFKDRKGLGITMDCMAGHCAGRLWILFDNPLDGGPAYEDNCVQLMMDIFETEDPEQYDGAIKDRPCGKVRWVRSGETFETLTLKGRPGRPPSIDAHECGHLTLTNGELA